MDRASSVSTTVSPTRDEPPQFLDASLSAGSTAAAGALLPLLKAIMYGRRSLRPTIAG